MLIRVDPGSRKPKTHFEPIGKVLDTATFGIPIASSSLRALDKLFSGPKPLPIELDTETGVARLVHTPKTPGNGPSARNNALAEMESTIRAREAMISDAWRTGTMPASLPKKYRAQVQALLDQRAEFYTPPAAATPDFIQYGGDMSSIIPPGGFTGFAQMTSASRAALTNGLRGLRGTKKRRSKKAKKAGTKRRRSRKGKKLVKGSAAAKKFMANLRKRRKK